MKTVFIFKVFFSFQAREGFSNLVGVDYSENAIELAKTVARAQNLTISYEVCDLLDAQNSIPTEEYAIALDKGTYDAISLHPDDPKHKREQYISNVWNLLKTQGLLIITSCNWTEKELVSHFNTSEYIKNSKSRKNIENKIYGLYLCLCLF